MTLLKMQYVAVLVVILVLHIHTVLSIVPLWPLPQEYSLGTITAVLSRGFQFKQSNGYSILLNNNIERYQSLIFNNSSSSSSSSQTSKRKDAHGDSMIYIDTCVIDLVTVHSDNIDEEINELYPGVDESYRLTIDDTGSDCVISSNTVYGAIHALETFTQLLVRETADSHTDSSSDDDVILSYLPVDITDSPRFNHRGLLIDTSRHYLSVDVIKEVIASISYHKFNVLHIHLVDAQSFPFQSESAADIVKGAYSSSSVYTMDDVNTLTAYAANHNIRVIIEIDVPGHAASWMAGYPSIMADCIEKYSYNINDYALNPVLSETYDVIEKVLYDIMISSGSSSSSKYIHLGGDEVVYGCWDNDSSIKQYMLDNGLTSYNQLLSHFVSKVDAIVNGIATSTSANSDRSRDLTIIHWEEVFTANCTVDRANTVYQVWTDSSQIIKVVDANYRVIASPSDYWYLNILATTWQDMYTYDPYMNISVEKQPLIIGGEVGLWSEYIDDGNIIQTIYPRASAVSERLWSSIDTTDITDATDRLVLQRCRLLSRGIASAPVQPDYCSITYV